jgi:hypothetical protein
MSSSQRPLPDNTQHSQQRDTMPPLGFEPAISTGKRPQTYALDRAAPVIGCVNIRCMKNGASFKCSKCNIVLSRNSRVNVIVIPNNIKRCEHKSFLLGISRTPYISTETVKLLWTWRNFLFELRQNECTYSYLCYLLIAAYADPQSIFPYLI